MELLQIKCPTCHSAILQSHTTYATQHYGRRIIYKCANCPTYFSETKKTLMAGLKTPVIAWERKFHGLHQVLFLSAWVQEFFALVIEGDAA